MKRLLKVVNYCKVSLWWTLSKFFGIIDIAASMALLYHEWMQAEVQGHVEKAWSLERSDSISLLMKKLFGGCSSALRSGLQHISVRERPTAKPGYMILEEWQSIVYVGGMGEYGYEQGAEDNGRCWGRIVKLSATPLRNRPHMVFCSQGTS